MMMSGIRRTGMSKLANVLYVKQLQKNLSEEDSSIIVLAVHPGAVNSASNTNLEISTSNNIALGSFNVIVRLLIRTLTSFFASTTKGSYTSVFAAASPEVKEKAEQYKGAYLLPVAKIGKLSEDGEKEELAKELWETTERILAEVGV